MEIVKGARGKNLKMAQLFVEQRGDLFLDYGKNAYHHGIFKNAGVSHAVFSVDRAISLESVLGHLVPTVRTNSDMIIFIDGNFSEEETAVIRLWASEFPSLTLTVSQQTAAEVIEIARV